MKELEQMQSWLLIIAVYLKEISVQVQTQPNYHSKQNVCNCRNKTMSLSSVLGNLTVSGDVSVGDDLSLASDSAVLSFGADSEMKLTPVLTQD